MCPPDRYIRIDGGIELLGVFDGPNLFVNNPIAGIEV